MAAANNPFYVAPPDILKALQEYDQSYKIANDSFQQAQRDALMKEVGQQIQMTGKVDPNVLGRLMSGGQGMLPAVNSVGTILNNEQSRALQQQQIAESGRHNRASEGLQSRQIGQTGEYQQGQLAQSAATLENTRQQQAADLELRRQAQAEQRRQHDIAEKKPIKVSPSDRLVDPTTFEEKFKGAGGLDDDTVEINARREVGGDQSWRQNIGRGTQGATDIQRVMNRTAQILINERNFKPQQAAEYISKRMQAFKAEGSGMMQEERTAAQIEARMAIPAFEAAGAIKLARGAIERVPRSDFLPLNKLIQGLQTQTLKPNQRELAVRTQGVLNSYSAVMSRGALVVTDFVRKRADDLLGAADNPAAYNRALDTMESEIDMAKKSPQQAREFFRSRYGPQALQESKNLSDQTVTGVDVQNIPQAPRDWKDYFKK